MPSAWYGRWRTRYTAVEAISLTTRGATVISQAMFRTSSVILLAGLLQSVALSGAGIVLVLPQPAFAQDDAIEEIVTIGSRVRNRTQTETPVAVDVFDAEVLERTGFTETGRLLQQLAPSFNFGTNNTSDGSDSARPATLRGLGPDQVLVLVNGKRHVGQAWLNIGGSLGRGSTGVDINSIPVAAIKRIEVLRDGASSQYGSDAMAGVINIVLKDSDEDGAVSAVWGSTFEGDGDTYTVAVNKGFSIAEDGFFNVTLEARDRDPTNRAGVSNRSFAFQGATPTAGARIFRLGDAEEESLALMFNGALPIGSAQTELYFFGKYMERDGQSTGFYRHPHDHDRAVPQVFPDGFLPLQNTDIEDRLLAAGIRGDLASEWTYDASVTYGANEFEFGAENTINASIAAEFLTNNPGATNAEIGANAGPTSGKSGSLDIDQLVFNIDFAGELNALGGPLYLAVGGEVRTENYEIGQGDLASYSCGLQDAQIAFDSVNTQQGLPNGPETANCGFQGFPGYSPASETDIDRTSFAIYVDAEKNLTDAWLLGAALRYEDYEDVGERLTGKIVTRVEVNDGFALRAAVSTGFRAASLPQQGFTSVVTQAGAGGLTQSLIANLSDPFTQALGISSLDFETSQNFSAGFVWQPVDNVSVTVDAYQIDIDDRVTLSASVQSGDLSAAGLDTAAASLTSRGLGQGAVFFNALDTSTRGVDAVLVHDGSLLDGELRSSFSWSYVETDIDRVNTPAGIDPGLFFDRESRAIVEDVQPNSRGMLSFDWQRGDLGAVFRANYFGETSTIFFTAETIFGCPPDTACGPVTPFGIDPTSRVDVSSAVTIDFELSYNVTENLSLALGANNLFDEMPDKLPDNAVIRWISDGGGFGGPPNASFGNFDFPIRGVPYGLNGGFYYLRGVFTL